jgi:5-methylthioadenosine/S-adenosylhomocysteine deaminase
MSTTLIKNADWIVAWEAAGGHHAYRLNGDVAFTDDVIVHVARATAGRRMS